MIKYKKKDAIRVAQDEANRTAKPFAVIKNDTGLHVRNWRQALLKGESVVKVCEPKGGENAGGVHGKV